MLPSTGRISQVTKPEPLPPSEVTHKRIQKWKFPSRPQRSSQSGLAVRSLKDVLGPTGTLESIPLAAADLPSERANPILHNREHNIQSLHTPFTNHQSIAPSTMSNVPTLPSYGGEEQVSSLLPTSTSAPEEMNYRQEIQQLKEQFAILKALALPPQYGQ